MGQLMAKYTGAAEEPMYRCWLCGLNCAQRELIQHKENISRCPQCDMSAMLDPSLPKNESKEERQAQWDAWEKRKRWPSTLQLKR